MTWKENRAVVEEIHSDIFAYNARDDVLKEFEPGQLQGKVELAINADKLSPRQRGGWSSESESKERKIL